MCKHNYFVEIIILFRMFENAEDVRFNWPTTLNTIFETLFLKKNEKNDWFEDDWWKDNFNFTYRFVKFSHQSSYTWFILFDI